MSRPVNKTHMQQMKEDMLKERGGDPKKYGPGYQNPYQYQPKKAQGKVDKKAFDSNFKNQT